MTSDRVASRAENTSPAEQCSVPASSRCEDAKEQALEMMAEARCRQTYGPDYWDKLGRGERAVRVEREEVVLDALLGARFTEKCETCHGVEPMRGDHDYGLPCPDCTNGRVEREGLIEALTAPLSPALADLEQACWFDAVALERGDHYHAVMPVELLGRTPPEALNGGAMEPLYRKRPA